MSVELRWRDRVTIAERELTVVSIIVAGILDKNAANEADWSRLVTSLHRLRALMVSA